MNSNYDVVNVVIFVLENVQKFIRMNDFTQPKSKNHEKHENFRNSPRPAVANELFFAMKNLFCENTLHIFKAVFLHKIIVFFLFNIILCVQIVFILVA